MKRRLKELFPVIFLLLLIPVAFAAIGSHGNYNSQTKFSFVGYDSSSGSGHTSRGSNQITGSFSIGTTYSGRFGILKYCGNSIIDSGETCDGTNLNGETCSSRGYKSGTLACKSDCSFDASGCTSAAAQPSSAAGGGGAGKREYTPPGLEVSQDLIDVKVKQGGRETLELKVKNTGSSIQQVSIDLQNLKNFILVSEPSFLLRPYEEKTLTLDFTASEAEIPDVYTGTIYISSESAKKIVRVIIEVQEKKALFDVKVNVPENFKTVGLGGEMEADIMMYNIGDLKPVDVVLTYAIKDFEGNTFDLKQETLAVEDLKKLRKKIRIPEGFKANFYVIYALLEYQNQKAVSSDIFEVKEEMVEERMSLLLEGLKGYSKEFVILIIVASALILLVVTNREIGKFRSLGEFSFFGRVAKRVQQVKEGIETRSVEQKAARINRLIEKSQEHVARRELIHAKKAYKHAHDICFKLPDEEKTSFLLRLNNAKYKIRSLEKSLEKGKPSDVELGRLRSGKNLYVILDRFSKKRSEKKK
jgi:hypothetical protein